MHVKGRYQAVAMSLTGRRATYTPPGGLADCERVDSDGWIRRRLCQARLRVEAILRREESSFCGTAARAVAPNGVQRTGRQL
jgi:hypothetical protein